MTSEFFKKKLVDELNRLKIRLSESTSANEITSLGGSILTVRKMIESLKGGLWLTLGKKIVLDNHNSEVFCEPYDQNLMLKEELVNGISFKEFRKRISDFND